METLFAAAQMNGDPVTIRIKIALQSGGASCSGGTVMGT